MVSLYVKQVCVILLGIVTDDNIFKQVGQQQETNENETRENFALDFSLFIWWVSQKSVPLLSLNRSENI